MRLSFMIELFTGKTVQALCWTLVHSLWLGLLLAAVAGIIILSTRRSCAALRYNLLTAFFLFFSAAIVITFCLQLNNAFEKKQSLSVVTGTTISEKKIPVTPAEIELGNTTVTNAVVSFLNEYSTVIVFVWLLIIAFRFAGLISGLYNIHKIKNRQITDPGEYWNDRLQSLAARLEIKKKVRMFQSGIAKIPMVLGHFKPIILFPVALLATLPQDEVEAILIHELAHIRRKDYLLNMFQHLMEIFFFFNPAVLWVSALIKTERENCCDDIAVAQTGNKRNYINALLSFQEYNMITPRYATGFTNKRYYLLQRIKRIIYNNNKTLNAMEKTFLASGLVLAGLLAVAFSQTQPGSSEKATPVNQTLSPITEDHRNFSTEIKDTVPVSFNNILIEKGITNLNTMVNGKRYELKIKNDVITELTIDGEKIPDGKIAEHKIVTDDIIYQAKKNIEKEMFLSGKAMQLAELDKLDAEKSLILAHKLKELSLVQDQQSQILNQKLSEMSLTKDQQSLVLNQKLKELQPELKMQKELLQKLSMVNDQQKLILDQKLKESPELKVKQELLEKKLTMLNEQQILTLDLKEKELLNLATKLKLNSITQDATELALVKSHLSMLENEKIKLLSNEPLLKLKKEQLSLLRNADAEKLNLAAVQLKLESEKSMLKAIELEKGAQTTSDEIINDLIHEKIIKNKKDLSFTLSNDELIVNGVKQPTAIHKKLKEKYVKAPDWNFNYNNKQ